MTTMQTAFASVGITDPAQIAMIDGRYVHACPLPDDYLASRITHQSVTSEVMLEAPAKREPRVFHISQMQERPEDLVDGPAFDRDVAIQLHRLVSLGDFDPALAYAQLKEWDGLCAMYERLKFNTVEYAKGVQEELQRVYREAGTQDEIPRAQIERLNEKLQGLRVQCFYYSRKFKMALAERELAVGRSGIDFAPYVSIAERAKKSAQAWAQRKRQRASELDRLIGMTDGQYRQLQESGLLADRPYTPRLNGVEAGDDAGTPLHMGTSVD
jgi:hypothetical protein